MLAFSICYGYLHLHVQRSLMDRQIRVARLRQEEFAKRNQALKQALQKYLQNSYDSDAALPMLANNRIVHIQLAEIPEPKEHP